MKTETAVFRGLRFGWKRAGTKSKPILLMLHGFPDTPETWAAQAEHFHDEFDIVCPHARGSFPSEPSARVERYGQRGFALDCLQLLDKIDPKRKRGVYLVGHDLGTVHASYLASLLGRRAKALVLVNGLPLPILARRLGNPRQLLKSWYVFAMQIPRVPEWLIGHFPDRILGLADKLGEIKEAPDASRSREHLVDTINQYRAFARELPAAWREGPRRLRCPVLVLWGKRDAFVVAPTQKELIPFSENGTIRILDGNHWIHRDRAAEVNGLLDRFFRETRYEDAQPRPTRLPDPGSSHP